MKVLHINCNYIGTTLHQIMVDKLEDLGIENNVFVPTYDKNTSVIIPHDNVCISECFEKWNRISFFYKQYKIINAIKKEYYIKSFDIIHAYTLFTDGNVARNLSKKYGVPYVVAVRNTDVNAFFKYRPYLRKRGIRILQDASAVFFLSESYKKKVFEKYIPKSIQEEIEKKVFIIPNGIDKFWLENRPVLENNFSFSSEIINLIYAGRIDRNKNITTIQKAIDFLKSDGYNVKLTVVGKIIEQKEYERIIEDTNTKYIPAQPKEKLINLYRKHDIFVMPSFTESFGLVYAEAMSQGLPIVYSKGEGFDGQFEEGRVGYSIDPSSSVSVKNGILNIINSKVNKKDIIECANNFNWENISSKYIDIYKQILDINNVSR